MNVKILLIKEINGYDYVLEEENTFDEYKLNIEFAIDDFKVTAGDKILISKDIIDSNDRNYTSMLTFGKLDSPYGKKVEEENKKDIIIFISNEKKIYLKRLYG